VPALSPAMREEALLAVAGLCSHACPAGGTVFPQAFAGDVVALARSLFEGFMRSIAAAAAAAEQAQIRAAGEAAARTSTAAGSSSSSSFSSSSSSFSSSNYTLAAPAPSSSRFNGSDGDDSPSRRLAAAAVQLLAQACAGCSRGCSLCGSAHAEALFRRDGETTRAPLGHSANMTTLLLC
jgi:hypothetical protein